jgi:hypothetical protein
MTTHEEALKALGKKPKEEKERYVSQKGWVKVPVYRGFTEITRLYYLTRGTGCFILGGYVRYMCSPSSKVVPAGDVDLYSPNRGVFEHLRELFKSEKFEMRAENDLAITYWRFKKDHPMFGCPQVQLIKPMEEGVVVTKGDMEVILQNFDFTVVRIGLRDPSEALADADFLHDEEKKFLRIKNIHCPVSTIYRVMKYNRKGYWPSSGQIVKILIDWDDRDDEYKNKIIEFLRKTDPSAEEIDELEKMMRVFD